MLKSRQAAVRVSLQDLIRPREVGEQVVCHVLENVRQPKPDFEAMNRVIKDPTAGRTVLPHEEGNRAIPADD